MYDKKCLFLLDGYMVSSQAWSKNLWRYLLQAATDYQISVSIDTIDFGQSAWSDPIIALTKALQPSDSSDVAQLKTQMVSTTKVETV